MAREVIRASGGNLGRRRKVAPAGSRDAVALRPDPGQRDRPFHLRPVVDDATVADNHFDGLAIPFWSIGQAGSVSIRDNRAEDCFGGFWHMYPDAREEFRGAIPEIRLGPVAADAFPLPEGLKIGGKTPAPPSFVFQVTNNDLAVQPLDGSPSHTAVLLYVEKDTKQAPQVSVVTVSNNRLTNLPPTPRPCW